MKFNINYIYSFLFLLTLCSSIFFYRNNTVLESRINTITKNSTVFSSEKTFKEDYYITQQSHDTNVLLVAFASLVAISGIFNYLNLRDQYNHKVDQITVELKKEMDDFKVLMKESQEELDNFKNQYYLERVELDISRANDYLLNGDKLNYMVCNLSAANKMCDFYSWAVKNGKELEAHSVVVEGLITLLNKVNIKIVDKIDITKTQVPILEDYFKALRLVDNKEITKLVSKIHVKFNETEK